MASAGKELRRDPAHPGEPSCVKVYCSWLQLSNTSSIADEEYSPRQCDSILPTSQSPAENWSQADFDSGLERACVLNEKFHSQQEANIAIIRSFQQTHGGMSSLQYADDFLSGQLIRTEYLKVRLKQDPHTLKGKCLFTTQTV